MDPPWMGEFCHRIHSTEPYAGLVLIIRMRIASHLYDIA